MVLIRKRARILVFCHNFRVSLNKTAKSYSE